MILSEFNNRYWRNKENEDTIPTEVTCKNCKNHFDGNYCPKCGQGVKELDHPFGFIFINFVGDMFAFDSRFFRTAGALLFKPGYLSQQFFEGKRVRYATPTRVFILSSFLLFFLLQLHSNRILSRVLDSPVTTGNVVVADSVPVAGAGLHTKGISSIPDSAKIEIPGVKFNLESFAGKKNIREGLLELSNQMEEELRLEEDPEEQAKLREQIRLMRTPEQAIAKILKYMSWAFFLLLPVFALILKLFYIRRGYFFIRHLVFSLHLHTFIFFIYILLVSLFLLFHNVNAYISLALLLTIPVYILIALKRFYGQRLYKVFLKFAGITIMYSLLFWIVVGGVFLKALSFI